MESRTAPLDPDAGADDVGTQLSVAGVGLTLLAVPLLACARSSLGPAASPSVPLALAAVLAVAAAAGASYWRRSSEANLAGLGLLALSAFAAAAASVALAPVPPTPGWLLAAAVAAAPFGPVALVLPWIALGAIRPRGRR